MNIININGTRIEAEDGANISIQDGVIQVGGNSVKLKNHEYKVTIHGKIEGNLKHTGSAEVKGNVGGSVDAGGSVQCGNVTGSVDAGGSVRGKILHGGIDAGGSVHIG